jgi:uncharacterized protein (TIGR03118 family)
LNRPAAGADKGEQSTFRDLTSRRRPTVQRHFGIIRTIAGAACAAALSACGGGGGGASMGTVMTTGLTDAALASNGVIASAHTDPNLLNSWGLASQTGGVYWVANNNSNTATVYDGTGAPQAPVVTIAAGANGPANPTGMLFNTTADFMITTATGTAPAQLILAGEGGTITAWARAISGTAATIQYDDAAGHAVYKGLAMAHSGAANFLYATDLHNAKVDMFDTTFHKVTPAGAFADPTIPAGFAPFGIQALNNQLYVTYAKQDATAQDEVLGAGLGYVNVFDASGTFVKRFATGGALNAPWGIAMAPAGFVSAAGNLLIGNFGDGTINRFDAATGASLGPLSLSNGKTLAVPGLWALAFGDGSANSPATSLFYTAGPNNQSGGLLGRVDVFTSSSPPPCTGYGC